MKIEILGTGCAKCKKLYAETLKAVEQKGISAEVVKVEDVMAIASRGVMRTPALVIDGDIKIVGRVADSKEIADLL